jgi:hypothetical protein
LNGPPSGKFAQVATLLLEAGAPREKWEASEEVQSVLAAWDAGP